MRRQRPAQLVDKFTKREAAVFIDIGGLEEGRDVDGSYFDAGVFQALGEFGRRERAVSIFVHAAELGREAAGALGARRR